MRPILFTLLVVNILSLLKIGDAALTYYLLQTGAFVELNPFVKTGSFTSILLSPIPMLIFSVGVFCAGLGSFVASAINAGVINNPILIRLDKSIGLHFICAEAISICFLVALFYSFAVLNNFLGVVVGFTIIDLATAFESRVVTILLCIFLVLAIFPIDRFLYKISSKICKRMTT